MTTRLIYESYLTTVPTLDDALFSSDGTAGGTTLLATQAVTQSEPILSLGTTAVFVDGLSSDLSFAIGVTNGTPGGTTEVSIPNEQSESNGGGPPADFTSLGTFAIFAGLDANGDNGLWRTDGTSQGTTEFYSNALNANNSSTESWEVAGIVPLGTGRAVMSVVESTVNYTTNQITDTTTLLWVTDGTSAGTTPIGNYNLTPSTIDGIGFGPDALFSTGGALWISDGTTQGTTQLNLNGALAGDVFAQIDPSTGPGSGMALFSGGGSGSGLYRTDGTSSGTQLVAQIGPISGIAAIGSSGRALVVTVNGLYVTDGTTTTSLTVPALQGDSFDGNAETYGNDALFSVSSGGSLEYWQTDGTTDGTSEIPTGAINPSVMPAVLDVTCFASGTLIRTPRGEVAVQNLRAGDTVVLADGCRSSPVVDVIHHHVDCRAHPNPAAVWPVRVAAGAFDDGLPRRDLWLSPDHAVFVNDVLIPIKRLINGTTVTQVQVDAITYHHVELPRHDVLLAEGLPAESYLDRGDRERLRDDGDGSTLRMFIGAGSRTPDIAALWETHGYTSLVMTGPPADTVRATLRQRSTSRAAIADTLGS